MNDAFQYKAQAFSFSSIEDVSIVEKESDSLGESKGMHLFNSRRIRVPYVEFVSIETSMLSEAQIACSSYTYKIIIIIIIKFLNCKQTTLHSFTVTPTNR